MKVVTPIRDSGWVFVVFRYVLYHVEIRSRLKFPNVTLAILCFPFRSLEHSNDNIEVYCFDCCRTLSNVVPSELFELVQ